MDPARGLCAAFCCKEALCKALQATYPYSSCEFFYNEDGRGHRVRLARDLRRSFGITALRTTVECTGGNSIAQNVVVTAYLF
jgi:hypothetical protein